LSGDTRLPKLIGLKASRRTPLFNGNLECRLYEYRLIAGSMRAPAAERAE
jgi:putative N6-adenine-specific DNA methylase